MPSDIDLVLARGFSLCTYEITYFLPDCPRILGPTFVLQRYDLAPSFPELRKFLDFWENNIEGTVHSVRIASQRMIRPREITMTAAELRLH